MALLLLGVFGAVAAGMVVMLGMPVGGKSRAVRSNIHSLVSAQRQDLSARAAAEKKKSIIGTAMEEGTAVPKVSDSRLSLRKKLKFAQWQSLPPYVFSLAQIAISVPIFLLVRIYFGIGLQIVALSSGVLFMNWLLMWRVNARYEKFDKDYPQFLLSLVGLLKTGMNPIQALEAAAEGLEEGSLVRLEVELMLERLRLGVPEERSVGSFGEDVNHPEIELFVQALILSRRVGGNLSDTLDRLARQVRKRQYFRHAANAAVGLQLGSIWVIIFILVAMELFLFLSWREILNEMWNNPIGRSTIEYSICGILLGLWWVKQVTKIKT